MKQHHWRQVLHLEPPKGWLNDPNGLCYFKGNYHVYFQYAPKDSLGGGGKHWGHFQSPDMLHWVFTGTVLNPDIPEDRNGVYSGSAVATDDSIELFYTGNVKDQGNYNYITDGRWTNVIRVSSPDGHTMGEKQVLLYNKDYPEWCTRHVRDPKVWIEDGTWHMVLGARRIDDSGCVLVYHSSDGITWSYDTALSIPDFGFMWECPDLFNVDGTTLLSISPQGLTHEEFQNQNIYSAGYFKMAGKKLLNFQEWDQGFDFYAPQTFQAPDGRRILIGWMGMGDTPFTNPTTELGWQHCLTLPREVSVDQNGSVLQAPIRELEQLRQAPFYLTDGSTASLPLPFDLTAQPESNFSLTIDNAITLQYQNGVAQLAFSNPKTAYGRDMRKSSIGSCSQLRIIADTSSLEIYLDGGKQVMSTRFYPAEETIALFLQGMGATIYPMKPMEVLYHGE